MISFPEANNITESLLIAICLPLSIYLGALTAIIQHQVYDILEGK